MAFVKTSPADFEAELIKLRDEGVYDEQYGCSYTDEETVHLAMDEALCRVLTENGYWKAVQVFKHTPKWYA